MSFQALYFVSKPLVNNRKRIINWETKETQKEFKIDI